MKKWLIGLSFLLLFGFIGTFMPSKTYACSCARQPDPMKAVEQSQAVFSGKVLEIQDKALNIDGIMDYKRAVLIDVEHTWKGISQSQAIVLTNYAEPSCGFPFKEGETYLVYASSYTFQENMLEASLCSSTKQLSNADLDLTMIGPGVKPTETISLQGTMDRMAFKNKWALVEAVYHRLAKYHIPEVIAVGLVVGVGLLTFRKRKKA